MISYQQVLPILVIGIGKIHYRSSSSNDGVHSGSQAHVGELCCVLSLDIPVLEKRTRFLTRSSSPRATLDWGEDFTLWVHLLLYEQLSSKILVICVFGMLWLKTTYFFELNKPWRLHTANSLVGLKKKSLCVIRSNFCIITLTVIWKEKLELCCVSSFKHGLTNQLCPGCVVIRE